MATLFDRLLRDPKMDEASRSQLIPAPVFDVSNVAKYYFAGTTQEEWDVRKHFPNIAPPYPLFWTEYQMPDTIVSDVFGKQSFDRTVLRAVGALWQVEQSESEGWAAMVTIWLDRGKHEPLFCAGGMKFPITKDGEWGSMDGETITYSYHPSKDFMRNIARSIGVTLDADLQRIPVELRPIAEGAADDFVGLMHPLLLALSFLHCKNVTVTEERPPDWQQKAAIKKHDRPLVTYHVLNIEPMKTVLRTEGDVEHNGLQKALHICRGHFKTYTTDHPLFGRVTGTFWWQSHVRGSAEIGISVKDYSVHAPKQH